MAKKKRKQEVVLEQENNEPVVFEEEQPQPAPQPLFESEAYSSMQREAGSDVTVIKQVGIGGPVPIVAPKQTTIQLQPIVVPLAVVPYMTQDSSVLRTDRPQSLADEYVEATNFAEEQVQSEKKAKKKFSARWFVLSTLILSVVLVLPYVLAYSFARIGMLDFDGLDHFNVIGIIGGWITNKSVDTSVLYRDILFIVSALAVAVMVVVNLIALIAGKYPRIFNIIASVLAVGTPLAVLIVDIVKGAFVANDRVAIIVFVALGLLNFLLAFIFTIVLNHKDDKDERQKYNSEI